MLNKSDGVYDEAVILSLEYRTLTLLSREGVIMALNSKRLILNSGKHYLYLHIFTLNDTC